MNRVVTVLFATILIPCAVLWSQQLPAASAAAQSAVNAPPTADQVKALLESSDAKDQAWGAWWVAQASVPNLNALLQSNLKAHLGGLSDQDNAVIDTTLDAFIQLGGNPLPLDVMKSVYLRRPAQGFILLSRMNPSSALDAFLLTLLDSEADRGGAGLEWFTAANLLIEHRAAGLAASLLRGLRITATITVCDKGQPCMGRARGQVSGGVGGPDRIPGFPPWPIYSLSTASSPGSAGLTSGPRSITYQRRVISAGSVPDMGNYPRSSQRQTPSSPTTAERLKYVAAVAPQMQMSIRDDEKLAIEWRDSQSFAAEVERFRQDILGRYSTLVQQLRNAGLLSPEEASSLAAPNLEVIFDDKRSIRTPL